MFQLGAKSADADYPDSLIFSDVNDNEVAFCHIIMANANADGNARGIGTSANRVSLKEQGVEIISTNSGAKVSNNHLHDNVIEKVAYGINFFGFLLSDMGNVPDSSQRSANNLVENNTIIDVAQTGIHLISLYETKTLKNKIYLNSSYNNFCSGINENGYSGLVSDNYVYGIKTAATNEVGISITPKGGSGSPSISSTSGYKIYNNTVLVDNPNTAFKLSDVVYATVNLKNNIFTQLGKGTAFTETGDAGGKTTTSNYNCLYTNGTSLVRFGGASYATLPLYQTGTLIQDSNSVSVLPKFLDNGDFHCLSSELNGKGISLAVLDAKYDIEGDIRATKPDIGCDEFEVFDFDLGLRDVVITSPTAGAGKKPISVMLRNLGNKSLTGQTVKLSYSMDGGVWSAPESYTIKGLGLLMDEEVFSFANTIEITEAGKKEICVRVENPIPFTDGRANNNQACGTYCSVVGISPTYTVDATSATADFKNLSSVVDFLKKFATCGLLNSAIFNLQGTFNESITLPFIPGMSENVSITFRSATGKAEDVVINAGTGLDSSATISVDEGGYYRFENLTVKNESAKTASAFQLINGVNHTNIQGCTIQITGTKANCFGIYADYNKSVEHPAPSDFQNNISNNTISGGFGGIAISYSPDSVLIGDVVSNNTISNVAGFGIKLSGDRFTELTANKITGVKLAGIILEIINKPLAPVSNNMVTGFTTKAGDAKGISVNSCNGLQIVHNSVVSTVEDNPFIIPFVLNNSTGVVLKNNILVNNGGGYVYNLDKPSAATFSSDYNAAFSKNTLSYLNFAFVDGKKTFADLQAMNLEKNSLNYSPIFVSASDLHTVDATIDGKASPMAQVMVDIDNQARDAQKPDIGCDEFSVGIDAGITVIKNAATSQNNQPINVVVTINNSGNTALTTLPVAYTINNGSPVTEIFSGTIAIGASVDYTFTQSYTPTLDGVYTICAKTALNGDINAANDETCKDITVSTVNGIANHKTTNWTVYPNPFENILYLQGLSGAVSVYNVNGQILKSFIITDGTVVSTVDVSDLQSGVYFVQVINKQGIQVVKLIK